MNEAVQKILKEKLGFKQTYGSDRDFRDIAVWQAEDALRTMAQAIVAEIREELKKNPSVEAVLTKIENKYI